MIDEQGWILRNRIIWEKPNAMPSSVKDRFSNKYEPIYMLVKQKKYWFDLDIVREPCKQSSIDRNKYGWNSHQRTHSPDESRGMDHRHAGGLFNPLGKNPGDVWKSRTTPKNRKDFDGSMGGGGSGFKGHSGAYKSDGTPLNHPLGKNPGDCWTIPTRPYPESHFATFPVALIEPMIKAACPAEICPVCGMARERITARDESSAPADAFTNTNAPNDELVASGRRNGTGFGQKYQNWLNEHPLVTTDWTSCSCDAGWIAGTVLDPFAGAGTSLLVARDLGRSAIGIEISEPYCQIIKKRIDFSQQSIGNSIKYIYEVI